MFAILICDENLEEIISAYPTYNVMETMALATYLKASADYYFVRGYVAISGYTDGQPTILPEYIVKQNFEIDLEHARHDWDQIVRL